MKKQKEELFDVVAVSDHGSLVLWVMTDKTERNAEAIINMAVMRQGVADRFFTTAQPGRYKEGDIFVGDAP